MTNQKTSAHSTFGTDCLVVLIHVFFLQIAFIQTWWLRGSNTVRWDFILWIDVWLMQGQTIPCPDAVLLDHGILILPRLIVNLGQVWGLSLWCFWKERNWSMWLTICALITKHDRCRDLEKINNKMKADVYINWVVQSQQVYFGIQILFMSFLLLDQLK